jgi:hypothetical protein
MNSARNTGISELRDDEIGWSPNIANFDSTWLHIGNTGYMTGGSGIAAYV